MDENFDCIVQFELLNDMARWVWIVYRLKVNWEAALSDFPPAKSCGTSFSWSVRSVLGVLKTLLAELRQVILKESLRSGRFFVTPAWTARTGSTSAEFFENRQLRGAKCAFTYIEIF